MKSAVVVYSLTGHTRKVADAVASRLGATVVTLVAPALRRGFLSTFRLGFRTFFLPRTAVHLDAPLPDDLDLVVLAAPVWAGRVAFPMAVWLKHGPKLPARRGLVMSGGAPTQSDAALAEFSQLVGGDIVARLYTDEATILSGQPLPAIEDFCRSLGA
jgi:hypothetical protein